MAGALFFGVKLTANRAEPAPADFGLDGKAGSADMYNLIAYLVVALKIFRYVGKLSDYYIIFRSNIKNNSINISEIVAVLFSYKTAVSDSHNTVACANL